jgi:hypothetical protein
MTVLAMVRAVEIELQVCAQVAALVLRQRRVLICVAQHKKLVMRFTAIRLYHGMISVIANQVSIELEAD